MVTVPAPAPVPAVGRRPGMWSVADDGLASRAARARGTGPYEACLPARLADLRFELPADLAADLADAEAALVAFDLHSTAVLGPQSQAIGPMSSVLLRTESASSSQIEDLTVGARQLALAELAESTSPNAMTVVANVRTMEAALRLADRLDLAAILRMHAELMAAPSAPPGGELRRQLVWVGRSGSSPRGAAHIAPEAEDVPAALEDLIAFIGREDLPILAQAAIAHAQFETIHPFTDGNGRTGRALVHAMIHGKGLVTRTTAPVSAGLLTDHPGYIASLDAFRAGDARPVLEQFARAARYAAVTGRGLVEDLSAQLDLSRERLSGLRRHAFAFRLLPLLVAQPIVHAAFVREALGTSAMSAQRALAQLAEAGVLTERTGRSRGRVWQHDGILAVLDAYAEQVRRSG
ncbi:Fic family protein [Brachybacterium hainanense]|uniref:Fic family protein n=1 Tax=Brachybacterium hainanense TaxID=1541174 RepID=A0ABV6RA95_9MICO